MKNIINDDKKYIRLLTLLQEKDIEVLHIILSVDEEMVNIPETLYGGTIEKMNKKGHPRQIRRAYDKFKQLKPRIRERNKTECSSCEYNIIRVNDAAIFITSPMSGKTIDDINKLNLLSLKPVSERATAAVSPKRNKIVSEETKEWVS